ncbi:hypothetical protein OAL71_01950 [Phycisphaerales bacterium]|nr:hypothetical protein [Phycisphaerales bacterium]
MRRVVLAVEVRFGRVVLFSKSREITNAAFITGAAFCVCDPSSSANFQLVSGGAASLATSPWQDLQAGTKKPPARRPAVSCSNGAYRSRTGDLLLAKHGFHEIEYVRRWKNRGTDALRTGRLYDTRVIRVIEIKQVADVADRRVMSSSRVGRQSVQLTTKVRSRIPERKPAPTRGRGGLVGRGEILVVSIATLSS